MASRLTVHALRTYFGEHPRVPEVYVADDAQVWARDQPYAQRNAADFISAWVMRDLAIEAFTGEPATMGLQVVESLAEAAGIEDGAGRYGQLRHDLAPELPEFLRRMRRCLYGGRDIWPDCGSR